MNFKDAFNKFMLERAVAVACGEAEIDASYVKKHNALVESLQKIDTDIAEVIEEAFVFCCGVCAEYGYKLGMKDGAALLEEILPSVRLGA